ncbi:MAG: hypothetical protein U9P63_01510 [Patescibacteria group bacterium]|nr:hypothetical protein [Patescibacteria group bacterium]
MISEDVKEVTYEDESGVESWVVLARNATIEGTLSEIEFSDESKTPTDLTLNGAPTSSPTMIIKTNKGGTNGTGKIITVTLGKYGDLLTAKLDGNKTSITCKTSRSGDTASYSIGDNA